MDTNTEAAKRPASITGICVVGLLGVVGLIYLASSGALSGAPDWYMPYLTFSAIAGVTALAGMFMMQKWGFYLYAGLFALNQIVMLSTGLWSIQSAIAPAVVILVASRHLAAMR